MIINSRAFTHASLTFRSVSIWFALKSRGSGPRTWGLSTEMTLDDSASGLYCPVLLGVSDVPCMGFRGELPTSLTFSLHSPELVASS